MVQFYTYINWRALENLPGIELIYPFSFLFGIWLLLKTIGWLSSRKMKNKYDKVFQLNEIS